MTTSETLHTLSRMLGALRNHTQVSEVVYQCGAWKCCDRIEGDGDVTRLYSYPGEPSIYLLKVTMYCLGRPYTVRIDSAKEICHA